MKVKKYNDFLIEKKVKKEDKDKKKSPKKRDFEQKSENDKPISLPNWGTY